MCGFVLLHSSGSSNSHHHYPNVFSSTDFLRLGHLNLHGNCPRSADEPMNQKKPRLAFIGNLVFWIIRGKKKIRTRLFYIAVVLFILNIALLCLYAVSVC